MHIRKGAGASSSQPQNKRRPCSRHVFQEEEEAAAAEAAHGARATDSPDVRAAKRAVDDVVENVLQSMMMPAPAPARMMIGSDDEDEEGNQSHASADKLVMGAKDEDYDAVPCSADKTVEILTLRLALSMKKKEKKKKQEEERNMTRHTKRRRCSSDGLTAVMEELQGLAGWESRRRCAAAVGYPLENAHER